LLGRVAPVESLRAVGVARVAGRLVPPHPLAGATAQPPAGWQPLCRRSWGAGQQEPHRLARRAGTVPRARDIRGAIASRSTRAVGPEREVGARCVPRFLPGAARGSTILSLFPPTPRGRCCEGWEQATAGDGAPTRTRAEGRAAAMLGQPYGGTTGETPRQGDRDKARRPAPVYPR
jgi:hypothetical protein